MSNNKGKKTANQEAAAVTKAPAAASAPEAKPLETDKGGTSVVQPDAPKSETVVQPPKTEPVAEKIASAQNVAGMKDELITVLYLRQNGGTFDEVKYQGGSARFMNFLDEHTLTVADFINGFVKEPWVQWAFATGLLVLGKDTPAYLFDKYSFINSEVRHLTQKEFRELLEVDADTLIALYKTVSQQQKDLIMTTIATAVDDKSPHITRDKLEKFNEVTRENLQDSGRLKKVLAEFNAAIEQGY